MMWYSGSEGGHAFADVLLGNVDASGRLPFSIPKSESDLPFLDVEARSIEYDRWFGQRLLDRRGVDARFPMGYGLSYTSFEASKLSVDASSVKRGSEDFVVRATVKNTGQRSGRYIAQVYALTDDANLAPRVLLGFKPVDVGAGQSQDVEVVCSTRPLQLFKDGSFVMTNGEVSIELATYSGERGCLKKQVSF